MTTHHIQMALATAADMDVGYELAHLVDAVARGDYPSGDDQQDAPDYFDEDDIDHLKALHKRIVQIGDKSGGLWRILGGWSCVTNPKNRLLDLTKDVVDFHPRIAAADELLAAVQGLKQIIELAAAGKDDKQFVYLESRRGTFIKVTDALIAAEQAIAKATGT